MEERQSLVGAEGEDGGGYVGASPAVRFANVLIMGFGFMLLFTVRAPRLVTQSH